MKASQIKLQRYLLLGICLVLFCLNPATTNSQEIKATTEDGQQVLLNPDGTWVFIQDQDPAPQKNNPLNQFFKPKSATVLLKGKRVAYGLWYDSSKWGVVQVIDNASAE